MLIPKQTIFWEYKLLKKDKQTLEDYFNEIKGFLLNGKKVIDIQIIFWEEKKMAYGSIRFLHPHFYAENFVKINPNFSFYSELEELNIIKSKIQRDYKIYRNWEVGNSNLRKNMEKLLILI